MCSGKFCSVILVLLLTVGGMFGCKPIREKKTVAQKEAVQDTVPLPVPRTIDYQKLYDALERDIGDLVSTESDQKKDALVATAWDTVSGGFFCPGKAVLDPKLPEAVRAPSRKRGAQLTAERWALLLRQWKVGEYHALDKPIQGQITYSDVVFEKQAGDTLELLVLVPLGSIVIGLH